MAVGTPAEPGRMEPNHTRLGTAGSSSDFWRAESRASLFDSFRGFIENADVPDNNMSDSSDGEPSTYHTQQQDSDVNSEQTGRVKEVQNLPSVVVKVSPATYDEAQSTEESVDKSHFVTTDLHKVASDPNQSSSALNSEENMNDREEPSPAKVFEPPALVDRHYF